MIKIWEEEKKHTCERDLVRGPVAVEVVVRPSEPAPLEAKHLLPRADRSVLDPSFTNVCCCCLGEDLEDIYRQNLERIVCLLG
jgi:hypothetical protein